MYDIHLFRTHLSYENCKRRMKQTFKKTLSTRLSKPQKEEGERVCSERELLLHK